MTPAPVLTDVQVKKAIVIGLRDLGHFLSAFAASFLVTWLAAGAVWNKALLFSLAPAAATVAFRQVFPQAGLITSLIAAATKTPIAASVPTTAPPPAAPSPSVKLVGASIPPDFAQPQS